MSCTEGTIVMLLEKIKRKAQRLEHKEFIEWLETLKQLVVDKGLEELDYII